MYKTHDTLNKAYGHIPKELSTSDSSWDWIPSRSIRYFYLTLWRKMFR